ncbi:hypothetical protein ACPC54_41250 [Kitasatospora sp. NPDC094028]
MTIPPPPSQPPTAGMPTPDPEPVVEWWRKDGPRIPAPASDAAVHTPVPVGAGGPAAPVSMEEAATAFWAPVGRILAEQVPAMAAQIGQQVTQLMTETEAQRFAREQVEYEARIEAERAERDALFAAAGETSEQQAERHRVEDALTPKHYRRDDLVGMVDLLASRINETPEERTARLENERELDKRRRRAEEDRVLAAAGETPEQRTKRHRRQQLADKREAAAKARRKRRRAARTAGPSDRVLRFRRWCVLTAISAVGGYATGLVQITTPGGPYVGVLLALFGWALDLHLRDRGRLRVSEVRGPGPLALLVLARIPVASGIAVATGAAPLLSALHIY